MIVYLSLCFYGEVHGNWDPSDGFTLDNLSCMFFPWECMRHEHAQAAQVHLPAQQDEADQPIHERSSRRTSAETSLRKTSSRLASWATSRWARI